MRLIDADEIEYERAHLIYPDGSECLGYRAVASSVVINSAPTVDAVPVVRCKDCKSWEKYNACDGAKPHRCMNYDAIFYKRTEPDDFCSYGERRTENG